MKDGFSFQGTSIDVMGGSYGRAAIFAAMGQAGRRLCRSMARSRRAQDNGYRDIFGVADPPLLRRHRLPAATAPNFISASGGADNVFGATAAAPAELLEQSWSSVYTTPQSSRNQVGYVNATATVNATPTWTLQGALHVRSFYQIDHRRQLHQHAALRQSGVSCASTMRRRPPTASTASSSPTRSRRARRSAKSTARRTQTTSVGATAAGDQYRQTVRPRQSFRDRRQFRLRRHAISAPAPNSASSSPNYLHPRVGSFPRAVGRSGLGRSGLAAHDQRLYRALRARHVRRDDGVFDLRRRPAQCRQYPASTTNSAAR